MIGLYVFALADRRARPFRYQGHRVEFLEVSGVPAAIERLPADRAVDPRPSESALRTQHEIVIRIAAAVEAVLPVRFGAVLSEPELAQVLASRAAAIGQALELVRGRVQMTLRFRAPAGAPASRPARPPASGTAYLQARRHAATPVLPAIADDLISSVKPLVSAQRVEAGPEGKLSVYHLIDRGKTTAYTAAVSPALPPAITLSGPWPPFAFAPDLWA